MKALFTTLASIALIAGQAQLTQKEHKVVLYSGDVVTGESLVYETPIMQTPVFSMNGDSYESNTVEYFQNNHGYFANLGRIHGMNKERYAMRIILGKINLYEEIDLSVYGSNELQTEGTNNNQDPMLATGKVLEYYTLGESSMGETSIRKATYSNLKIDLKDNASSMIHLKKHRNYKILQLSMIGIGSGILAANLIANANGAVKFNPVMAIGIAIGGGSYFMEAPKQDELWLAADEYNKETEVLSER